MSVTPVDLYRSIRIEDFPQGAIIESQPAPEILYPDFSDKELPDGRVRRADVKFAPESKDGKQWILSGGGTSLFDRAHVFKGKNGCPLKFPKEP